jgi:protein phosphatase
VRIPITAICDVGLVRENNEDMVLVGSETLRDGRLSTEEELDGILAIAVADGMGGAAAGEVASAEASRRLQEAVSTVQATDPERLRDYFADWTESVQRELRQQGLNDPNKLGMGTTLVALILVPGRDGTDGYCLNVGDSRLYRLRNRTLRRLTRDHTLRELGGQPRAPSHILLNAFGGTQDVFADFERMDPPPAPGDVFLLSTDGLHDVVAHKVIEQTLRKDADAAPEQLVRAAKEEGAPDNVSVVVVRIPQHP